MGRENAPFSGTLMPREIDPEVGMLKDPNGGSMLSREYPEVGTLEDPDEDNMKYKWRSQGYDGT